MCLLALVLEYNANSRLLAELLTGSAPYQATFRVGSGLSSAPFTMPPSASPNPTTITPALVFSSNPTYFARTSLSPASLGVSL